MTILSELSEQLLLTEDELLTFSATAPRRYKKYYIPKRSSTEFRLIAHPAKEVKFIQRLLVDNLKDKLPIHYSAMAYISGRGIRDNAIIHKNSNYILKMDFKNFFLSINPSVLYNILEYHGIELDSRDKNFVIGMFFWKLRRNSPLRLSIGAPSSPFISNVVMYIFDDLISNYCKSEKIQYTRYADDLTFSTKKKGSLDSIPKKVTEILKQNYGSSLRLNSAKTVFLTKAHNRHITGITINNNGELSLGRKRKRYLSSLVHKFSLGLVDKQDIEKLRGYLAFAEYIEPDFIVRLNKKYGEEVLISIKSVVS